MEETKAGPQTLRALRALIVSLALIVHSNLDNCDVFVDEGLQGTTGPGRKLVVKNLSPGNHVVSVRRQRYKPAAIPIELIPGRATEISAELEMTVGFLTVNSNVPNARIQISDLNVAGRSLNNLEIPPGTYTLTVNAPQYLPFEKTFSVKPGETVGIDALLRIDPSVAQTLAAHAEDAANSGDYAGAFRLAQEALRIAPDNPQALALSAMGYFYAQNFGGFLQYGTQALQSGSQIAVPVVHIHTFKMTHKAWLRIRSNSLAYDPNGQPGVICNQRAFDVSWASLRESQIKQNQNGSVYLSLKLADPGSFNKGFNLNFVDYRSATMRGQNGLLIIASPPQAREELAAVNTLIEQLWRRTLGQ